MNDQCQKSRSGEQDGDDDRGNETEVSVYDKDDRMQAISLFKLTLDKQGNWIKKVQSDNERTTGVVEREIAYY